MSCGTGDFLFPMQADIFYPSVEQAVYGNVKKQWMLDRTVSCYFSFAGNDAKEELKPNVNITKDILLVGRTKIDLRVSSREEDQAMVNIVVSNIRDKNCNPIHIETSGIRKGKSTIFEIATVEPFVGIFGSIEYYKLILKRSENQSVDV